MLNKPLPNKPVTTTITTTHSMNRRPRWRRAALLRALLIALCVAFPSATNAGPWYQPSLSTTWHWQLSGTVNTSYEVDLYDIDLVDTPQTVINDLHRRGKKVICYFSAGSSENWRSDFERFAEADQGKPLGDWPGERWLDIRATNVMDIMLARLDLAAQKGCDGVEPDNVDGYTHDTGFPLTAADQLTYNQALANAAHARNLAVGLKNDLGQAGQLADFYDFSVNEQCHTYHECNELSAFTQQQKPVFNAEYAASAAAAATLAITLCPTARNKNIQSLILPTELNDSFRVSCQSPAAPHPLAPPQDSLLPADQ